MISSLPPRLHPWSRKSPALAGLESPKIGPRKVTDMVAKKVALLTTNFFNPAGERIIMGGAERYQVDLCRLLKEMGFYVEVWQIGGGWTREFDGVRIRSIPVTKSEYYTFPDLTTAFYENSMAFDYAIYFILTLAYPLAREKSIAISHGVFWDWPGFDLVAGKAESRQEWLRRLGIALAGPSKLVSVDTNTINFFNATLPGFYHKWEYIFVRRKKSKPVRILFASFFPAAWSP